MERNSKSSRIGRKQVEIRRTRGTNPTQGLINMVELEAAGSWARKRSRVSASAPRVFNVPVEESVVIETPAMNPSTLPSRPSVIHNQPPGAATHFFWASVCPRDLNLHRSIYVPVQERAFHSSFIECATVFESLASKARERMERMERTAVLEQSHKENQSCISLLEQDMSQLHLTYESSQKQIEDLTNQNKVLERKKRKAT